MKHLIAQQKLEIHLTNQSGAFALQQELSDWYWQRLVPAMEQLFERLAGPGMLVRLDKIHVELQVDHIEQLRTDAFLSAVLEQLQKAIEEPMQLKTAPLLTQKPWGEGLFDLWLFFLECGMLPIAAAAPPDATEWHRHILDTLATERTAVDRFWILIHQQPLALERLVLQHPPSFLNNLALITLDEDRKTLFKSWIKNTAVDTVPEIIHEKAPQVAPSITFLQQEAKALADQIMTRLKGLLKMAPSQEIVFQRINPLQVLEETIIAAWENQVSLEKALSDPLVWQRIWSESVDSDQMQIWWQIIGRINPQLMLRSTPIGAGKIKKAVRKDNRLKPLAENLVAPFRSPKAFWAVFAAFLLENEKVDPAFAATIPTPSGALPATGVSETDLVASAAITANDLHQSVNWIKVFKQEHDFSAIPLPANNTAPDARDGFYLNNAGLVLLHPFLGRFFKNSGLVEDGNFKQPASLQRAVCLLHYLATGQVQSPEYQLVLPKFLCGMPFNLPLDHSIRLTNEEIEESENLLSAVVEHWATLGSTSPDGLREGFLQREGKLSKTDTGWIIDVEHNTLDILLNSLPWGISMVKFPWMPEPLRVQWH